MKDIFKIILIVIYVYLAMIAIGLIFDGFIITGVLIILIILFFNSTLWKKK